MLTYNTNSKTGPVCGGRATIQDAINYNVNGLITDRPDFFNIILKK